MEEKHNSPPPTTADQPPPPPSSDPQPSRRRGGKRKSLNTNTSTPSKRQAREKHSPSPVLIHNGPLTRAARSQPVYYGEDDAFWEAVVVNGSGGGESDGGAMVEPVVPVVESVVDEEEMVKRREAWEALEVKIEKEVEEVKARGANVHVVPVSCVHFKMASCGGEKMPEVVEFMKLALEQAKIAFDSLEVPVGCVLVMDGNIISRGRNRTNETRNATRHV